MTSPYQQWIDAYEGPALAPEHDVWQHPVMDVLRANWRDDTLCLAGPVVRQMLMGDPVTEVTLSPALPWAAWGDDLSRTAAALVKRLPPELGARVTMLEARKWCRVDFSHADTKLKPVVIVDVGATYTCTASILGGSVRHRKVIPLMRARHEAALIHVQTRVIHEIHGPGDTLNTQEIADLVRDGYTLPLTARETLNVLTQRHQSYPPAHPEEVT